MGIYRHHGLPLDTQAQRRNAEMQHNATPHVVDECPNRLGHLLQRRASPDPIGLETSGDIWRHRGDIWRRGQLPKGRIFSGRRGIPLVSLLVSLLDRGMTWHDHGPHGPHLGALLTSSDMVTAPE